MSICWLYIILRLYGVLRGLNCILHPVAIRVPKTCSLPKSVWRFAIGFLAIGILYLFFAFFRIFLGFTQYNHLLPKNSLTYDIDNMCLIIELTFLIKKNIFKVKILHFFFKCCLVPILQKPFGDWRLGCSALRSQEGKQPSLY